MKKKISKSTVSYKLAMKVANEVLLKGFTKTMLDDYEGHHNDGMPILLLEKKDNTKIHVVFDGPSKYQGSKMHKMKIGWTGHT
jgi:hypothetical protein